MSDTTNDGSWLGMLAEWSVGLMDVIGAPGAALAIALENIFPPLPSEVILPMAGLAASRGSFTLVEAIAWTTAGSIVGALLLYGLGALLGLDRLRAIAARVPLLHPEDIDRTVAWFAKHGGKAVLFGRMIPIFRSLISIPAGITRMPLWRFTLLTGIGSLVWNTVFVLAGFFLGEAWPVVEQYTDVLQYIVIVVAGAAVAWFVIARVRGLWAAKAARKGARPGGVPGPAEAAEPASTSPAEQQAEPAAEAATEAATEGVAADASAPGSSITTHT